MALVADVAITVTVAVVGTTHTPAGTGSALKHLAKCLTKNCTNSLNNIVAKKSGSK